MLPLRAQGYHQGTLVRVVAMAAVLLGVYAIQQLGVWWYPLAIRPGQAQTWALGWGSFLLHGNLEHLLSNVFGLSLVLLVWPRLFTGRVLLLSAAVIQVTTMLVFYLMPQQAVLVIGASHLLYGFWVMLGLRFFVGLLRQGEPRAAWGAGALLLGFYGLLLAEAYGEATAVVGTGISWEGHVAGMAAGVVCAWLWRNAHPPLQSIPQLSEVASQ